MPPETFPYDSAELLDNDESIAGYLEAAFETNDAAFIAKAFGIVARAKGMTHIAKDAGYPAKASTVRSAKTATRSSAPY
jgi:probable addiction module antidote protein